MQAAAAMLQADVDEHNDLTALAMGAKEHVERVTHVPLSSPPYPATYWDASRSIALVLVFELAEEEWSQYESSAVKKWFPAEYHAPGSGEAVELFFIRRTPPRMDLTPQTSCLGAEWLLPKSAGGPSPASSFSVPATPQATGGEVNGVILDFTPQASRQTEKSFLQWPQSRDSRGAASGAVAPEPMEVINLEEPGKTRE